MTYTDLHNPCNIEETFSPSGVNIFASLYNLCQLMLIQFETSEPTFTIHSPPPQHLHCLRLC